MTSPRTTNSLPLFSTTVDLSQNHLIHQLEKYLRTARFFDALKLEIQAAKLQHEKESYQDDISKTKRIEEINKMIAEIENQISQEEIPFRPFIDNQRGMCQGFSIVVLYIMYTGSEEQKKWLSDTLFKLSAWDGDVTKLVEINDEDQFVKSWSDDFDELFGQIIYHQYLPNYRPVSLASLSTFLPIENDYSLTGLFTKEELITTLKKLLQEDRIAFIANYQHAMGLLSLKEQFYFYDPNDTHGLTPLNPSDVYDEDNLSRIAENLANNLFEASNYQPDQPSPFSISILRKPGQEQGHYPSRSEILSGLKSYRNQTFAIQRQEFNHESALTLACYMDDVESLKIYKQTGVNLEAEVSLIDHCIMWNSKNCFNFLIENGAKLDQSPSPSVCFAVSLFCDPDILQTIINLRPDVNVKDDEGKTPLQLALMRNDADSVKILLSAGAMVDEGDLCFTSEQALLKWITTFLTFNKKEQAISSAWESWSWVNSPSENIQTLLIATDKNRFTKGLTLFASDPETQVFESIKQTIQANPSWDEKQLLVYLNNTRADMIFKETLSPTGSINKFFKKSLASLNTAYHTYDSDNSHRISYLS